MPPAHSRRAFFGASAALIAGGAVLAAAPPAVPPARADAELIDICHRFAAADFASWYRYVTAPEDIADEQDEDPDWATLRLIAAAPATTPEGWHAKALAYAAWDREAYDGDKEDSGTALLASLLRDMVKPARAVILEDLARRHGPFPEGYDEDWVWQGYPEVAAAPAPVPVPVIHGHPDAYLLEACQTYMIEYRLIKAWDDGDPDLDEDEARVNHILHRRRAALERIIPIHPRTPAGLQAKAEVALVAMDAAKGTEVDWETSIGRKALVELIAARMVDGATS